MLKQVRGLERWERCGPAMKAFYATGALLTTGNPHLLTLRLDGRRIEEAFRTERGPVDHLRREIARRLRRALGETPDFWVVAELVDGKTDRLHFHGMIDVPDQAQPTAKRALLEIGDFYRPRKLQLQRPRAGRDPLDWGIYAGKNVCFDAADLPNCPLSITRSLNRRAAELYEFHRMVVRSHQRPSSGSRQAPGAGSFAAEMAGAWS